MKKRKSITKKHEKKKMLFSIGFAIILIAVVALAITYHPKNEVNTVNVIIETNMGNIELELNQTAAPITVENFLSYVDEGFYNGLIFHRIIDGFMIQGGGMTPDGNQKKTKDPIIIESQNGLKNDKGTIAMARTMDPNSATSQFFINTVDNDFLNYGTRDEGYTVFGKVTSGMDVVQKIEKVPTRSNPQDWPVNDVTIISIKRK